MSGMIAIQSYGVRVHPGDNLVAAIPEDVPYSVRLTMAAIEPFPVEQDSDEEPTPSTLTLVKESDYIPDADRLIFNSSDEEDDEEDDEDEESDSDEEATSKKSSKTSNGSEELSEEEDEESSSSSDDDDDEEEEDADIETSVLCTLGPKFQYQQPLDLVLSPGENVHFTVTGSYAIHVTGNYVVDPNDDDYDAEDDEDNLDSDEFDLSPDEDELMLEDDSEEDELDDIEGNRIEEIIEEAPVKAIPAKEEESAKHKKNKKKHNNDESLDDLIANEKQNKSKKAKTEDSEEGQKQKKNVNFKKDLEQGPSNVQKLEGGLTIEDRLAGKGPSAKNGTKVSVRYTGKLRNGKVFDSNTKGKPFSFTLGKGEVIKGWELGVKGMAAGGERRITVPPHLAYGKKALPGIPANSELIFDVKVVGLK